MKRSILKDLISWKKSPFRKPLLLKGARQVGKTFILQEFGKSFFSKTHYFNFEQEPGLKKIFEENLDSERILKELSFVVKTSIDVKNDLVIFDEIQYCPEAITSLKYFCEDKRELALAAAGSFVGVIVSSGSFPVGKVDELTMFQLDFREFLEATGDTHLLDAFDEVTITFTQSEIVHRALWDMLKVYYSIGGMPEVVARYLHYSSDTYTALQEARKVQQVLVQNYKNDCVSG